MSNTPDLFTGLEWSGHAPHNHTATSIEAARKQTSKAEVDRHRILTFLRFYPATDEEMQEMLEMDANTQRPRRWELVKLKLVEDSKRTRKTKTGSDATVWRAR